MGVNMIVLASVLSSLVLLTQAVSPLTPEELKHIRDFTAKAHMKRLQNYPDQIMTPSTHYLGRRIPPSAENPPTIFMQAPSSNQAVLGVKPQGFQIEPQQAGAVQNFLVNYPLANNAISHQHQQQQQPGQIFQQQQQQQQRPQLQYLQLQQNAGQLNGPPRGPPPHFKRPPFFSFGGPESAPPTSLLEFFFPKRPARRPPSFRPPLRFEYAQTAPNPQILHHQNLHNVMTQQHLLTVQQQQQQAAQAAQQNAVRPSNAPIAAQSTTIKTSTGAKANPTAAAPSPVAPTVATSNNNARPIIHQNQQQQQQRHHPQQQLHFIPSHPPPAPFFNINQFHREVPFFGKPVGKPGPPQKYPPVNPAFVPQNRPGDDINYIQKYAAPQPDFSFLNLGPHLPPVIAGPTSNRFGSPVSFSHIEQMPFAFNQQPLPMHMVVQSQEFPHYQFTTTFTASNNNNGGAGQQQQQASPVSPSVATNVINNQIGEAKTPDSVQVHGQAASVQSTSVRQTQRVKKVRPRVQTTTPYPTTTQSLGDIIFESAKETREFHDSTAHHQETPIISHFEVPATTKPRKAKQQKHVQQEQQQEHAGSLQKASVESSVVLAPLVFTEETKEPATVSTSSPRPITSTLVSVSTISTTTPVSTPTFKPKVVKNKNLGEFHKPKNSHHHQHHSQHHHESKRVTASGSGLGAVTVEPLRISVTATSAPTSGRNSPGGRVVTTSVTSRVVSSGPLNAQKRYRLRKVKVPNPEAIKQQNNKTSTTSTSSSSFSSVSTSNVPSTTPISTSSHRTPRSTSTTISSSSSTESSLSTAAAASA